ncbi:hypothetical protein JW933_11220, partial [candidate division FCPU426 bacterium]|nr:hypothetical protein [candidate division FCPU426 bacterium]
MPAANSQTRRYFLTGIVVFIILTAAASALMWSNVQKMEKTRKLQHEQLAESMAKTAEAFLLNRDDHY